MLLTGWMVLVRARVGAVNGQLLCTHLDNLVCGLRLAPWLLARLRQVHLRSKRV